MDGTDATGGMPYPDFLNAIVDDAIEEVRVAYAGPARIEKLEGALRGLGECRDKQPTALVALLAEASATVRLKRARQAPDYWFWRLREAQVEWVLNVLSAAEQALGRDPYVPPTQRGLAKAGEILRPGVAA